MDVICRVGFGRDYESEEEARKIKHSEPLWLLFQNILDEFVIRSRTRIFDTRKLNPFFWFDDSYEKRMDALNQAVASMIDERIEGLRQNTIKKDLDSPYNGTLLNAIVDLDEEGNMIMTKQQAMDEIKTLLFAGYVFSDK